MTVRWRCGDPGDKSCDTATNRTNGMWCGVYNLRRVNISHFKAVDSRRFCYFYIFTNFPIPAGKCREMVSNPEASRKPRKSLSRSPLISEILYYGLQSLPNYFPITSYILNISCKFSTVIFPFWFVSLSLNISSNLAFLLLSFLCLTTRNAMVGTSHCLYCFSSRGGTAPLILHS